MESVDLLLVEDDDDDARHIERLLVEGDDDHLETDAVVRAARLSCALDRLETRPDAVLLDLNLPDSEGLETVERLFEHAPHLPVVVVTGSQETDLGREAIRLGAQDYLRKGHVTASVLYRTLRYAIERQDTQRDLREANHRLELLNRLVRRNIQDDIQVVVGRGNELRSTLPQSAEPTLETLLGAAHDALDHAETAGALSQKLSMEDRPRLESLDVTRLVATHLDRARDRFDASFSFEPPEGDGTIETTPALGSAIEQLLENGVRHADHDDPSVTVSVETRSEVMTVTVTDNGAGMPERKRRLLNDPNARYTGRAGLGTGLYLVVTVLDQVGGVGREQSSTSIRGPGARRFLQPAGVQL